MAMFSSIAMLRWLTRAWQRLHTWRWDCPRKPADSCRDAWHPRRRPPLTWQSRSTTRPCRTRRGNRCTPRRGSPWRSRHNPLPAGKGGQRPEVRGAPSCSSMGRFVNPSLGGGSEYKFSLKRMLKPFPSLASGSLWREISQRALSSWWVVPRFLCWLLHASWGLVTGAWRMKNVCNWLRDHTSKIPKSKMWLYCTALKCSHPSSSSSSHTCCLPIAGAVWKVCWGSSQSRMEVISGWDGSRLNECEGRVRSAAGHGDTLGSLSNVTYPNHGRISQIKQLITD